MDENNIRYRYITAIINGFIINRYINGRKP